MTYYCKIAEPVVDDLSPYAGWLYTVLARHIHRKINQAQMTLPELATAAHMSIRTVIRYTKVLEDKGLIAVQRVQKQGQAVAEVNIYSLVGQYAEVALGNGLTGSGGSASQAVGAVPQSHGLDSSKRNTPTNVGGGSTDKTPEEKIPQTLKAFFNDKAENWIRQLCQRCGFEYAVLVVEHTKHKRGLTNPVGYAVSAIREQSLDFKRVTWRENGARSEGADWMAKEADDVVSQEPPGIPPGYIPDEEGEWQPIPDWTPFPSQKDIPTEPDEPDPDRTPPVEPPTPEAQAWNAAYSQLERQLDRASFDMWLRGVKLLRVETGDVTTFTVQAANAWTAQTLQHRLHRDIHRVLTSVMKADPSSVALVFEAPEKAKVA